MWFIETPWPPIAICVVIGAFLLYRFSATQRSAFLIGAGALLALAAAIFFIELTVVTETERETARIEANVYRLADAVVEGDVDGALSFLSPRFENMTARIRTALTLYDIGEDMRITDLQVRMQAENSIGISHFRANGTITGKASSLGGRGATRWQLTWQRVENDWKIIEIIRLHPIRDDETLDMFQQPD